MIAQRPAPSPYKNETSHTTKKKPQIAIIPLPQFATPNAVSPKYPANDCRRPTPSLGFFMWSLQN